MKCYITKQHYEVNMATKITLPQVHSLGQGRRLQLDDSDVEPVQLAPPWAGAGLVHERERDHVPSSQVVLHVPQGLHDVHAPSTGRNNELTT